MPFASCARTLRDVSLDFMIRSLAEGRSDADGSRAIRRRAEIDAVRRVVPEAQVGTGVEHVARKQADIEVAEACTRAQVEDGCRGGPRYRRIDQRRVRIDRGIVMRGAGVIDAHVEIARPQLERVFAAQM